MESWQLKARQGLELEHKIELSKRRIVEWYEHFDGNVYISFSGGKDSTVLLHLVRSIYPNVPAVFCDTGLEYPEIRDFVKTIDNVEWLKPKLSFKAVIEKYGYPVVSKEQSQYIYEVQRGTTDNLLAKRLGKASGSGAISLKWRHLIGSGVKISHKCCYYLKKQPFEAYEKRTGRKGYVGLMAANSRLRSQTIIKHGCNAFDISRPQSRPLSVWLEQDIWDYIKINNLTYASIYDKDYENTGCMFCMFGVHLESEPNRFQRMKETHSAQYDYCINKLGCGKVLDLINVKY